MEYYSTLKKSEIMPFAATCMDLEIILNEVNQIEKRQISYDVSYLRNPTKLYTCIYSQNSNRLTGLENNLLLTREEK